MRSSRNSNPTNVASGSGLPNASPLDEAERVPLGPGLEGRYGLCPIDALVSNPKAVRTHSKKQIRKIARSMKISGPLAPLVIDEHYVVLAGHARLEAAKLNGEASLPVVQAFGLNEAQKRHYLLADNELSRDAGLDRAKLAQQLPELMILFEEAGFELDDTGFEMAELDEIMEDAADGTDEEEQLQAELYDEVLILRPDDVLLLGDHRLAIGDARDGGVLGSGPINGWVAQSQLS